MSYNLRAEESEYGSFIASPAEISEKMKAVRCLIFDWDGVFNDGIKGKTASADFAEADTMGINLLRYGLYKRNGSIPATVIITGQKNESAFLLARRDRFDAVYFHALHKTEAFESVLNQYRLLPEETAFFYDDVLDLPIAAGAGVRVLIRRAASPAFTRFVIEKGYCDYITAHSSGQYAIREASELLLALSGTDVYQVFEDRIAFTDEYRRYLDARSSEPAFWEVVTGKEMRPYVY